MDAVSPPAPPAVVAPAQPPPHFAVAAAGDIFPRTPRERELCDRASTTDWLYLSASIAAVVGGIYVDSSVKYHEKIGVRLMGPSAVGLSWGFLLGGMYLALPKCSITWVGESPREGGVGRSWPLALSLAMLAGFTAPLVMGIEQGYIYPAEWKLPERQARVALSAGFGFFGALLPYVLPPKTWRASKELERIRAEPYGDGAMLKYVVRF